MVGPVPAIRTSPPQRDEAGSSQPRSRGGVRWDEENLELNEQIKKELNPQKISEPKTPYLSPIETDEDEGGFSPLRLDADSPHGSESAASSASAERARRSPLGRASSGDQEDDGTVVSSREGTEPSSRTEARVGEGEGPGPSSGPAAGSAAPPGPATTFPVSEACLSLGARPASPSPGGSSPSGTPTYSGAGARRASLLSALRRSSASSRGDSPRLEPKSPRFAPVLEPKSPRFSAEPIEPGAASDADDEVDPLQAEKKRRFEDARKRHYNMGSVLTAGKALLTAEGDDGAEGAEGAKSP